MKSEDLFGNVIFSYTRRQAIEDGVLIDVTETAKEAGFKIPVAISSGAWNECVRWTDTDEDRHRTYQDESGRLWDVLFMLHAAIKGGINAVSQYEGKLGGSSEIIYSFLCVPSDLSTQSEPILKELKCVCGPNDDASPCMTIMLKDED